MLRYSLEMERFTKHKWKIASFQKRHKGSRGVKNFKNFLTLKLSFSMNETSTELLH